MGWFRFFAHQSKQRTGKSPVEKASRPGPISRRCLLTVEVLEDRVLPSGLGVLLLNPSSQGALTDYGNGNFRVTGNGSMVVDSSDPAAAEFTANGHVFAEQFDVAGTPGIQTEGTGGVVGSINTGAAAMADPLASLPAPSVPSTTFSDVIISGNSSVTLAPGTYIGGIQIADQASVTLMPGIYYLQGGGLAVTDNASLTGHGVMIYNESSQYADSIYLTTHGPVNLTPMTSGAYKGITLFQDRNSTVPMRIVGNGQLQLFGTIYAAKARINLTGNNSLDNNSADSMGSRVIVDDLRITGNGSVHVNSSVWPGLNGGPASGTGASGVMDPMPAITLVVSEPNTATAGASFNITVTAEDANGNTVTGFSGSLVLIASDGQTVHTTAGATMFHNGVATPMVALHVAHIVTLTAASGTIHGTGGSIAVYAGAASRFIVSEPGAATAGSSFDVTIMAKDLYGNTVTGFSGSVALTSSDAQTVYLAAVPTFSSGAATATVTLNTANTVTLTATSGTIHGTGGTVAVSSPNDWFSQNMPDTSLQNFARTDFTMDGSLTYSDMLGLFTETETDGTVTTTEFQSLQALVTTSGAAAVNMQASVQNLTYKVVNGDPANSLYQGASLGNLYAGSSANQLQELVAKWFLGEDHPTIDTYYVSGWGAASYQLASGSLFGSSGPSYEDIAQGQEGDCWLMSTFSVTAAHDPAIIQGMFTDDGTTMENGVAVHVWTVQFYHNGVTSYLTVDNNLPAIGGNFVYANLGQSLTSSSNILWVPLLEKAYAQLCASGWNQRPATNAYASLNGGTATTSLPIITGGTENAGNFLTNQSNFNAALAAGTLFTLASTFSGNSSLGIVPNHDYAVLGYDSTTGTYTLLNPWGWDETGEYPGILTLTWAQITANFSHDGNCTP
jgi:Calpain family cysteine protease